MSAWKVRGLCSLSLAVFGALVVPAFASVTPGKVILLAKITGPGSINQTDIKYQVIGTDLGIMWESGKGQVMVAFGDTYGKGWGGDGGGPRTADWRCNVLARSSDRNPDDGLSFDTMIQSVPGRAKQLLDCKQISRDEDTVIPTAGVTVGRRHYVHYMSVNNWGPPGSWFTNYSGIAYSDDDGENWIKDRNARWLNDPTWNNRFQMAAFVRNGGHVYVFGTPNGRFGNAYLARVPENNILNKTAYQYWDGAAWQTNNDAAAVPIVIAPVAELSVQFNSHFGRWIMTYFDERRAAIILRDSPSLTGQWTGQKILVKGSDSAPWVRGGNGAIGADHSLSYARSGCNNAYLRATSGFQNIYQDIAVTPNRNYRLTGWVKTSPAFRDGYFGVRPTNDAAPFAEVRYGRSVGTPADIYRQLTVDFNAGARTSVRVFVGMFGPGSDAFAQIDDLAVNLSSKRYRSGLRRGRRTVAQP